MAHVHNIIVRTLKQIASSIIMNVFHRDEHFPKRSSRSPHASKPPPMNEVMSDDDCKTKMEEVIKELELCKQIAGRNRLLPSTTLGNTES